MTKVSNYNSSRPRRPGASARPLPNEIYVRRRVAALVIILVVVFGLIWALSSIGGGNNPDNAASVASSGSEMEPSASPSEDPARAAAASRTETPQNPKPYADPESETAAPSESPGVTESASETVSETASELATKTTCELSDLKIEADSDKVRYDTGQQPHFFMYITNPTAADCTIDLDKELLRFEVYDLKDYRTVWKDTDCTVSVAEGTLVVPAGQQKMFDATWSRMESAPGQCNDRPMTPPGSYFLHTVIGNNNSPEHFFDLRS